MDKHKIKINPKLNILISLCSHWWKSNSTFLIYGYSKYFLQCKQCWYKNIFLCKHIFIPKGNFERPINLTVMFLDHGRKPKTPREPQGNPHIHREDMQTPYGKTPGWDLNPGPTCYKATVQPNAPLCSLDTQLGAADFVQIPLFSGAMSAWRTG